MALYSAVRSMSPWAADLTSIVPFVITLTHPATGVTALTLAGELDLLSSPKLDEHLDQVLSGRGDRLVILTMNHLSFCGVAGLNSLLRAHHVALRRHIHLHLVSGPRIDRLLRLAGLHDLFLTHPDLPTAVTAALADELTTAAAG